MTEGPEMLEGGQELGCEQFQIWKRQGVVWSVEAPERNAELGPSE